MHSSRMRTARSSSHPGMGGSPPGTPLGPGTWKQTPQSRPPRDQAPPGLGIPRPGTPPQDQAAPGPSTLRKQTPPGAGTPPPEQAPLLLTESQTPVKI